MCFVDGFLNALNLMTGKDYGFSGTNIYVTNGSGERIYVWNNVHRMEYFYEIYNSITKWNESRTW